MRNKRLFLEFMLWYNKKKNKGERNMIEVVIASIMCFIATTIDDLFLQNLLNASFKKIYGEEIKDYSKFYGGN